jgi:predicted RND superfamily exporter protein/phosphatidylglycerophosphatase A
MRPGSEPDLDLEPQFGRVTRALRAALALVAVTCFRRPKLVALAVACLSALAAWQMRRLTLDPDVAQLLPPWYESVQDVERLRERFGGVGYVVLLVEGGTPEARRKFADDVAPALERLPSVKFVDHRTPVEFFEDRGLYFADLPDLETIRDRLKARQAWQIDHSYLDLDDEPPPPVDFADVESKYKARYEDFGSGKGRSKQGYHEDEAGTKLAVFVRPTKLASDLTFAREVVADVERALAAARPAAYAPDLKVQLTGRYKKRVDLQALLGRDLAFTSALALVLVVGWVALHFRRALAVVLVLAPLYVGLTFAYGLAGALFGTLNVLTAFVGAILAGIGIDNGIHMFGRFEEERRAGQTEVEAVQCAFREAGRISLAAALTTASAFGALVWTDFRAFREFGVLAALGMMCVLFSYFTLLPAMLGLLSRYAPRLSRAGGGLELPGVAPMRKHAPAIFWALAAFGVLAAGRMGSARFNADFARLDDADVPSFKLDKEVNALLGRSQTPMVVLAASEADARETAQAVRDKMKALGPEATVGQVASYGDLLPEGQAEKAPVLREIAKITSRINLDKLDPPTRDKVTRLETMARAAPFGPADLPTSLRSVFEPKPGSGPAHFVLLYPTVSMSEANATKRLAAQLRSIELPSGRAARAAGEPMILADILLTVERDAPRILALTAALVLLVLRLTLGKTRLALLALSPAVVTLAVTAGLMPLFDVELNYLNMIILPILLGIGVDDGAHFVARVELGEPLEAVWRHTGWDVTGAILTDVFGFGVLALASHPGLVSVGQLALLGLGVNFVACIVALPCLLAFLPLVGPDRPRWSPAKWVATVAGAGLSPIAPGTVGALVALPIAWALCGLPLAARLGVCALLTAAATWFVRGYLREGGLRAHDPQEIVVDETLGCLIALCALPFEPLWVFAGFVAFRFFDIRKPGPIRRSGDLPGAVGVMADDVLAGVATAVLLVGLRALGSLA